MSLACELGHWKKATQTKWLAYEVDVCYLDIFLSAPTSQTIGNMQLVWDD